VLDRKGMVLDKLENEGNGCWDCSCCESPDSCFDFELCNLYLYCLDFFAYLFDVSRNFLSHLQEIAFVTCHVIPHLAFRYAVKSSRSDVLSS